MVAGNGSQGPQGCADVVPTADNLRGRTKKLGDFVNSHSSYFFKVTVKHNAFIVNAQSKAFLLKGELYISRRHFEVKPSFLQVLLKITTL